MSRVKMALQRHFLKSYFKNIIDLVFKNEFNLQGGKDFKESIDFVNKIAEVTESEGHYPDIYIYYNEVGIELHTHAVEGLTENDFIVATKIDNIKTGNSWLLVCLILF